MTRGILKNAQGNAPYRTQSPNEVSLEPLDREQVIENTKLNAQMKSHNPARPDLILENDEIASHLKWDEGNLLVNEMEKTPKMKIDEPKTPYEGGFDPNNDYYKLEPIEGLGDGMDDSQMKLDNLEVVHQSNDELLQQKEEKEGEADVVDIEDDISAFERKRRLHYKTEGNPLHHLISEDANGYAEEED